MTPITVAAGVVLRRGAILLVRQRWTSGGSAPIWSLPGGVARPGEFAPDALVREVAEETGLAVEPGRLLYVTQTADPEQDLCATALVYRGVRPRGTLAPRDPDGEVLEARFVPIPEAKVLLAAIPARAMREPILALLGGELPVGSTWCYRVAGGVEHRVAPSPRSNVA